MYHENAQAATVRKVQALRDVTVEQLQMVVEWQLAARGHITTTAPNIPWGGPCYTNEYYALWHFLRAIGTGEGLVLAWNRMRDVEPTERENERGDRWQVPGGKDVSTSKNVARGVNHDCEADQCDAERNPTVC